MSWSKARFVIWIGIALSVLYALPIFEAALAIYRGEMANDTAAGNSFLTKVGAPGGELFSLDSTLQPILTAFTIPALWLRKNAVPLVTLLAVIIIALLCTYSVHSHFLNPDAVLNLIQMSSISESLSLGDPKVARPAILGYIGDIWESLIAILFLVIGVEAAKAVEHKVDEEEAEDDTDGQ